MSRPVQFRREAEHDLREIIAWYESAAPHSLPAITGDIWRAIEPGFLLSECPWKADRCDAS